MRTQGRATSCAQGPLSDWLKSTTGCVRSTETSEGGAERSSIGRPQLMAETGLSDIREVSWFGIGPALLSGEWEDRSVQVLLGDVHEKLSCKSDSGLFS